MVISIQLISLFVFFMCYYKQVIKKKKFNFLNIECQKVYVKQIIKIYNVNVIKELSSKIFLVNIYFLSVKPIDIMFYLYKNYVELKYKTKISKSVS